MSIAYKISMYICKILHYGCEYTNSAKTVSRNWRNMYERLPTLELWERTAARREAGQDIVPMQGVPMLPMPEHVIKAVSESAGEVFPRATRGRMVLKAAIAEHLNVRYGLTPAPTYFFDALVRMAGAQPRYVHASADEGWALPLEGLEAAITPATRAIILCNPNNPTGYVPSKSELASLLSFAKRHDLYIFSDESYEDYVHDGHGYTPQMTLSEIYDRLITVTSFSKNYAFSSWRVGYIHAP